MNILVLISTYLQYYMPVWFYGFLNFASSSWVKFIGAIAVLLLARTIIVFCRSQRRWQRDRLISLEEVKTLSKGKLPFFSILVPARNEAEVVSATAHILAELNYPEDRLEIIIITDEKETLNAKEGEITTQLAMVSVISSLKESHPNLRVIHMDVPYDFDGEFGGKRVGKEIKSTKGRALNWTLTEMRDHFEKETDFFAFFDTDDHPDKNCLLHIAKSNLLNPKNKAFQLPVYQCRNFWDVSAFSKVVCLSQSFTHENFLPWIMTWLPFLGGTNLFIEKNILMEVKGFNYHSITEDLDLGVTIFLQTHVWPTFLPVPSSEQTPPTMKTYYRQRKRWSLGQLEVMNNLKEMMRKKEGDLVVIKDLYRKLCFYGPIESTLFFFLTVFSFVIIVSRLVRGIVLLMTLQSLAVYFSPSFTIRETLYTMASIVGLPMVLFSMFLLFRYHKFIEKPKSNRFAFVELTKFMIIEGLFIPLVLFVYPLPFFMALVEHSLGVYKKKELVWVKTPRTKEGN